MWIDELVLGQCHKEVCLEIWQPKELLVIGGNSNNLETEAFLERCQKDDVPLLKRCGGGGTVLLHPGCIIVSFGVWVKRWYENPLYFQRINQGVIQSLSYLDPVFSQLSQKGISDICFGEKKIAGTSMFRSRNYLLYQASILVEDHVKEIEAYLRHPSQEPDYRQGQKHRHFLGTLQEIAPDFDLKRIQSHLEKTLQDALCSALQDELSPLFPEQMPNLLNRVSKKPSPLEPVRPNAE